MLIKDFHYGFRFTDKNYSLFSSDELSQIEVISKEKANAIWNTICDSEIFQKSSYIKKILNKQIPPILGNSGWGECDIENKTKGIFADIFNAQKSEPLYVLYHYSTALAVSVELFCDKWSDFCYPSDSILLLCGEIVVIYYEDAIYGPISIRS